uniref:Uncharacterized protein n=1 Tax=Emiliania huxleyi TaxID=2903 RepID=A0A7S3SA11_EMIHU
MHEYSGLPGQAAHERGAPHDLVRDDAAPAVLVAAPHKLEDRLRRLHARHGEGEGSLVTHTHTHTHTHTAGSGEGEGRPLRISPPPVSPAEHVASQSDARPKVARGRACR